MSNECCLDNYSDLIISVQLAYKITICLVNTYDYRVGQGRLRRTYMILIVIAYIISVHAP